MAARGKPLPIWIQGSGRSVGDMIQPRFVRAVKASEYFSGAGADSCTGNIRKAMFDSVLATTCYRAGKVIAAPTLSCQQVHFALNQGTNAQILGDYLRWFEALRLVAAGNAAAGVAGFVGGGPSTCVLRMWFGDKDGDAMFFDGAGNLGEKGHYLEIGCQAMRALLDPEHEDMDKLRYRIMDDALWPQAMTIGANPNLGPLVGLSTEDVRVSVLIGDVYDITNWADAMSEVGALVQDVRSYVGQADPRTLVQDNVFKQKAAALQKKLAEVIKNSKTRFHEPWGMVCLYWAAGSPANSYGKVVTAGMTLERGMQPALPANA